jgi:recombination protein U
MNYPGGIKRENKTIYSGKRGMTLESDINETNRYYLEKDIALIYKKPTPIKVVKVDYNKRINTKITEAYYEIPSTTDYNGIYKGKYIDFEAKETKNKTSFSLNNIHAHQIKHLESVLRHGGISFLIIRFTTLNETYLLMTQNFMEYINNNDRKSIPYEYIKNKGYLIKEKLSPRLDYLEVLNEKN